MLYDSISDVSKFICAVIVDPLWCRRYHLTFFARCSFFFLFFQAISITEQKYRKLSTPRLKIGRFYGDGESFSDNSLVFASQTRQVTLAE